MFSLRPYQKDCIESIKRSFESGHKSPCLVLPTGSGKTGTVLSYLMLHEPSAKIVWLAPRVALIDQTWRQAFRVDGHHFNSRMKVTTVQALVASTKPMPECDVCVVDEAHFFYGTKEWASIAKSFPRRIAATATPTRADGAPLRELCDSLIIGIDRKELIASGYLPSVTTFSPERRRSTEAWGPVDAYLTHAKGEKAIVFCVDVQHAITVRDRFCAAGVRSGSITLGNETDLQSHAAGFLDVLTNVYMVSVGYDDPTVTTVILARPFGNPTSYIQAAGRARGLGSKEIKIIDLYGACHEWGLLEETRVFSLGDEKPIRRKESSQIAICNKCGAAYAENPFDTVCFRCREPRRKFSTPKEKRREAQLARYSIDTDDARFEFLQKMVAIMHAKSLPRWVPVYRYRKRYGDRPKLEWLERVGLR